MTDTRSLAVHHAIRSFLLFGFAVLIAYLVKTEKILYYVAPGMIIYMKLSAFGLYAIAVYQLMQAAKGLTGKRSAPCDCEHPPTGTWMKHAAIYAFFALPLILAMALP